MSISTKEYTNKPAHFKSTNRSKKSFFYNWKNQALLISGLFLVSRIFFLFLGLRLTTNSSLANTPGSGWWEVVDLGLLRNHLLSTIWYLNGQPPLFNLFYGLLVHFSISRAITIATITYSILGWIMALSMFFILKELKVPIGLAFGITTLFVLSPANILYETWLFYTYPTAVFLTFGLLSLLKYLKEKSLLWGFGFFSSSVLVILLNSTFQLIWLLVIAIPVVFAFRTDKKKVLKVAALPLLIVVIWYGKNFVLFGTTATSSWLGMNLGRITLSQAPQGQIDSLVKDHKLSPLAKLGPFLPPSAYIPHFVKPHHYNIGVLNQLYKSDGEANYNNPLYITLSSKYLKIDLHYIEMKPLTYAKDIFNALKLFFVPPDQYRFFVGNYNRIVNYAHFYDKAILWQPHIHNPQIPIPLPRNQLSYKAILEFGLTLIGLPIVTWFRRKDIIWLSSAVFLWITMNYVMVVTSLLEIGENNRFRFDLGPLPLIAAVVTIIGAVQLLKESKVVTKI